MRNIARTASEAACMGSSTEGAPYVRVLELIAALRAMCSVAASGMSAPIFSAIVAAVAALPAWC